MVLFLDFNYSQLIFLIIILKLIHFHYKMIYYYDLDLFDRTIFNGIILYQLPCNPYFKIVLVLSKKLVNYSKLNPCLLTLLLIFQQYLFYNLTIVLLMNFRYSLKYY